MIMRMKALCVKCKRYRWCDLIENDFYCNDCGLQEIGEEGYPGYDNDPLVDFYDEIHYGDD